MSGAEDPYQLGLSARLRRCVELVGSGNELARRAGLSRGVLERYLTGRNEVKAQRLVTIAQAAGVSVEWLATGDGAMISEETQPAPALGSTVDPAWMKVVSKTVRAAHEAEGVSLPVEALIEETAAAHNELLARAEDPLDRDELESLLPWLEARLRKRLKAARTEPGTGKRSA